MALLHYFTLHFPLSFVIAIMLIMNEYFPTQLCCAAAGASRSNETDMMSLLAIKAQITHRDSIDALSSWNDSIHFCQWKGVTCGKRHQRVTMLNLSSRSLLGYISPAIGNLSFLRVLDLSNNSFQGEVPPEIGYLFRLEELYLQSNRLGGPFARNMSNLRVLRLNNNEFKGKVPFELGSLSKLKALDLSRNKFSGSVPASFGNLSSLEELYIVETMLTGSIPKDIGKLKRLISLVLESNNLSGLIPSTIFNLSNLLTLSLLNNSFKGTLPTNMFLAFPKIMDLLLSMNDFSGAIPVSIGNASNLERINLAVNKFSGAIPVMFGNPNLKRVGMFGNNLGSGKTNDLDFIASLTNCSELMTLSVDNNNLGGTLPASIGNLSTKLERLTLTLNIISGDIPSSIGNLIGLGSLGFSSNQFSGSIPETIGNLQKLQELSFANNNLSGDIPSSIGNLTLLSEFNLGDNNFEGSIPVSLGNCSKLLFLLLNGNALSGTVPKELMGLSSLTRSLDLSRNRLSGSLPSEVGRLINLAKLDISDNQLSGEIPATIGSCIYMRRLHMNDNSFHGNIPSSLGALRGLEVLNLSRNNLSGEILKDFGTFPFLWGLDLSYNDFEGEVPTTGVFSNSTRFSLFGNEKLCGGILELQLSACSSKKQGKARLSPTLKVIISLIFGLLGLSFILFLLWKLLYKKERKQSPTEHVFHKTLMTISYHDLFKATNGFSSPNLVGMGGFGSVYKGILESGQKIVAIKVLDLQKRGASKSFIMECEALRNIRHKNLVKVITACSSVNHQGDEFKAIVYEFLPNGNLERWLHHDQEADNMIQEQILSLHQRINIVIDVATALDYLHNQCETPIIHCDLKPSNILLDDQMIAHVGDFGLAKFILPSDVHVSSNHISSSLGIKGTIGYTAPEYGMGSATTIQGDVYSFGILLLETFTGIRPTDDLFKEGLDIHGLAEMSLSKGVLEIVDKNLLQREEEASNDGHRRRTMPSCRIEEMLSSIIKVGVVCSKESPRDRMSIHDALNELRSIKKLVTGRKN